MTLIDTSQPEPHSIVSPRFGMTLPERSDHVLVQVLSDAFLVLDRDAASLRISNTFTAPQNFGSTVNVDGRLTVRNNGGLEVTGNVILANQAYQIALGGSGAFIKAYAPNETFVQISQLTVTPGTLAAAGLTVNGNLSVTGQLTATTLQSVGRLITNNWDIGWSNNLGGNAIVNGVLQVQGRLVTNAWDIGWANSLGGDLITSGAVHSRGGWRCWDAADFSFGTSVVGNQVVQRDASGHIWANYINTVADRQGGRPAWVAGQNGDNYLRWYPAAGIGAPANAIVYQASGQFNTANQGGGLPASMSVGLDRVGFWFIVVTATSDGSCWAQWSSGGVPQVGYTISWPGGQRDGHIERPADGPGGASMSQSPVGFPPVWGIITPGNVTFTLHSDWAIQIRWGLTLTCVFVPTADYPGM